LSTACQKCQKTAGRRGRGLTHTVVDRWASLSNRRRLPINSVKSVYCTSFLRLWTNSSECRTFWLESLCHGSLGPTRRCHGLFDQSVPPTSAEI